MGPVLSPCLPAPAHPRDLCTQCVAAEPGPRAGVSMATQHTAQPPGQSPPLPADARPRQGLKVASRGFAVPAGVLQRRAWAGSRVAAPPALSTAHKRQVHQSAPAPHVTPVSPWSGMPQTSQGPTHALAPCLPPWPAPSAPHAALPARRPWRFLGNAGLAPGRLFQTARSVLAFSEGVPGTACRTAGISTQACQPSRLRHVPFLQPNPPPTHPLLSVSSL